MPIASIIPAARAVAKKATRLALATLGLACIGFAGPVADAARAQDFPSRPLTLMVTVAPGGSVDVLARVFAEKAAALLGQRVIVENRATGAGNGGVIAVKDSAPDGYTLLFSLGGRYTVGGAFGPLPYDPVKELNHIALLYAFPTYLVVPANSPANTVAELVAYGKKKEGGLTFGNQGMGSPQHLQGAMLQKLANVPMVIVPYRGGTPMMLDMLAGRLDFVFASYAQVMGAVEEKKVRLLAFSSPKRSDVQPAVPTLAELGFADVDIDNWVGIAVPRATPAPVANRLREVFLKVADDPDILKRLQAEGMELRRGTPAEIDASIARDTARLGAFVRTNDIKGE